MWRPRLILLFLAGFAASFATQAYEVKLVDSEGNALHEAVLMQFMTESEQTSSESETQVHIMDQVNRQFAPQLIVIKRGDFVNFPNSDNVRHHVYSFSQARTFELELYEAGTSPDMLFATQGIVVVGCNIHDKMRGHIVVAGSEDYSISDENGLLSFPEGWESQENWFVWHPWMSDQGLEPQPVNLNDWLPGENRKEIMISVSKPQLEEESELESRFRRRVIRGGN